MHSLSLSTSVPTPLSSNFTVCKATPLRICLPGCGRFRPLQSTRRHSAQGRSTSACTRPRLECNLATKLSFRSGTASDIPTIRKLIRQESMNSLGLVPELFTVAVSQDGAMLGFGQLEPKDSYVELRSMIVDPSARGQGIGSAILKELLGRAGSSDIMLTTIGSRMRFYEKEGFQRLSLKEVPRSLLFEVVAGTVVARIAAGEKLVVMKKSAE